MFESLKTLMFAENSSGVCAQLGTSADMGHVHMLTSCVFLNACDFLPSEFQTHTWKIKSIQFLFMEEHSCNKYLFLSQLNLSAITVWQRSKGRQDKHKSVICDLDCGSTQMLHTKMGPSAVNAVQANSGTFLSSEWPAISICKFNPRGVETDYFC